MNINKDNYKIIVLEAFKEKYPYIPFKRLTEDVIPDYNGLVAWSVINNTPEEWIKTMVQHQLLILAIDGAYHLTKERDD